VLVSGLVTAPIVICSTTLKMGLFLSFAFSSITFLAIMIASLLPRNIVYTIRIILYTLISSLVYVPVYIMSMQFFPVEAQNASIYLPLLIVNSMIISQTEFKYFKQDKLSMLITVFFYIIGFDIVVIICSLIREIISYGTVWGKIVGIQIISEGWAKPFGGFIILGLLSGFFHKIINVIKNWKNEYSEDINHKGI
jgi:electron transport complex protein RnfE